MSTKARTGHEERGYHGFKRRREHLYGLEIVDKTQSFVNISEVTHLYIAIVDVVDNNATYTYVTQ